MTNWKWDIRTDSLCCEIQTDDLYHLCRYGRQSGSVWLEQLCSWSSTVFGDESLCSWKVQERDRFDYTYGVCRSESKDVQSACAEKVFYKGQGHAEALSVKEHSTPELCWRSASCRSKHHVQILRLQINKSRHYGGDIETLPLRIWWQMLPTRRWRAHIGLRALFPGLITLSICCMHSVYRNRRLCIYRERMLNFDIVVFWLCLTLYCHFWFACNIVFMAIMLFCSIDSVNEVLR